jgi:hypothetical protein
MIEINVVPSVPHYEFLQSVFDRDLTFAVRWNSSAESWFVNVAEEGIEIVRGMRVSVGQIMNREDLGFVFSATSVSGEDPGFDDLGSAVKVVAFSLSQLGIVRKTRSWVNEFRPIVPGISGVFSL